MYSLWLSLALFHRGGGGSVTPTERRMGEVDVGIWFELGILHPFC